VVTASSFESMAIARDDALITKALTQAVVNVLIVWFIHPPKSSDRRCRLITGRAP
jgi:hypothetical protein